MRASLSSALACVKLQAQLIPSFDPPLRVANAIANEMATSNYFELTPDAATVIETCVRAWGQNSCDLRCSMAA